MRTFKVQELGCKVNQYEGQLLREGLRALGLDEAPTDSSADLFILNSCSVTESGGAKSRSGVRRFHRGSPDASVIVTGCYAESDREVVEAIPGVVRVFGNADKDGIVPWVARSLLGMEGELPELPRGITEFDDHTRAFVKIQDGCRDNCTFCIIPSLRGDVSSRATEDIVEEVRALARGGKKEVVFTGIHLGYFGWDRDDRRAVVELLERVRGVEGLERVKLSSIEVHEITEELVDLFASDAFFVPHFHLPLQAGCDATLRRMRRKYSTRRFRDAAALVRERLDDPAVTTDVIVGFPGETAADFEASRAFCEEMAFSKMHIFPYSVRRGTPAATMPDHVPAIEIKRRKEVLAALDDRMSAEFRRRFVGTTAPVLVEERRGRSGRLTGLTDRFCRLELEGDCELMNTIVDVRVIGEVDGVLTGVLR